MSNLLSESWTTPSAPAECATFRRSDRKRRINEIGRRRFHSEGRGEKFELSVSERFANALDCRANTHSLLRPSPTPESCPDRGEIKQNRSLIGRERRFPQFWQKIRRNGEIMRARLHATTFNRQRMCAPQSLSLSPSPLFKY